MSSRTINSLDALNQASAEQASTFFTAACAAQNWVDAMVNLRPFSSARALESTAVEVWESLSETDYLEAFTAHPMIGDVATLKAKFANTKALASNEQSGVQGASEQTLLALRDKNRDYADKFGFIFIICASGLSADTMLAALQQRLANNRAQEIANAAAEQINITLLRLGKSLNQTD